MRYASCPFSFPVEVCMGCIIVIALLALMVGVALTAVVKVLVVGALVWGVLALFGVVSCDRSKSRK